MLWNDFRFALRILLRSPLYAVACVVTLTLAIGATAAVLGVVDATLLRPLPYAQAERLAIVSSMAPGADGTETAWAATQIELIRWRERSGTLDGMEGIEPRSLALTAPGEPTVADGGLITSGLFPLLGARPLMGRLFTGAEERSGALVAVLGYSLWLRRFGGQPSALGESVTLDGRTYQVIGVMPEGFRPLLGTTEIWIPLNPVIDPRRANNRFLQVVARLRPGMTGRQAEGELLTVSTQLAREFPQGHAKTRPRVQDLRENLLGSRRPALTALTIAVGILLLLACANVANLTLGQAAARRAELAARVLLGASRWSLARLMLMEAGILTVTGGLGGLALVRALLPLLLSLQNRPGVSTVDVTVNGRILLWTTLIVAGAALACGLLPALGIWRSATTGDALRLASRRASMTPRERRVRGIMVSAEVALAVALLCGAGTFATSLARLFATPVGYHSENVLTMQMLLPQQRYPDVASRAAFVKRALENVARVTGVLAAGTTQTTFLPNQSMSTLLYIDGAEETRLSFIRHVTPGYFPALGVAVEEGRAIEGKDDVSSTPVCLVSRAFAKQYFPGISALGHRVKRGGAAAQWMTVIGVAADVKDSGYTGEQGPTLYVPYLQVNTLTARISLVARTQGDPRAAASLIRQAIWNVDSQQPMDRVARLADVLTEGTSEPRFRTILLAVFALIGLALAAVGVYAVTAASVTARTLEHAIRLAVGAEPGDLLMSTLRDSVLRLSLGAAAGLGLYLLASGLIGTLLYGTSPRDPIVVAGAAVGTILLGLAATYAQARRVFRLSPAAVLRSGVDGGS